MTDKPLKTERLRRLNKTQSNKQDESQTTQSRRHKARGETKTKRRKLKIDEERSS